MRLDETSARTTPTSLKAVVIAFDALKKRAEEREQLAEKENSLLLLKVASLEAEVHKLRESIESVVPDDVFATMQTEFIKFQTQSDECEANLAKNRQLLHERVDGLQIILDDLKEPTSDVSLSPSVITIDCCDFPCDDFTSIVSCGPHSPYGAPIDMQRVPPSSLDNDSVPKADLIELVNTIKTRPAQQGETWYIVSRRWWMDFEQGLCPRFPPIDNRDIVDSDGSLLTGISLGVEVEAMPPETWAFLIACCGPCAHPLPRRAVKTKQGETSYMLELYPVTIKVYFAAQSALCPVGDYTPTITPAQDMVMRNCLDSLLSTAPSQRRQEFRLWKVTADRAIQPGWCYPTFNLKLPGSGKIINSMATVREVGWKNGDAVVIEPKAGNRWLSSLPTVVARPWYSSPPPPRVFCPSS